MKKLKLFLTAAVCVAAFTLTGCPAPVQGTPAQGTSDAGNGGNAGGAGGNNSGNSYPFEAGWYEYFNVTNDTDLINKANDGTLLNYIIQYGSNRNIVWLGNTTECYAKNAEETKQYLKTKNLDTLDLSYNTLYEQKLDKKVTLERINDDRIPRCYEPEVIESFKPGWYFFNIPAREYCQSSSTDYRYAVLYGSGMWVSKVVRSDGEITDPDNFDGIYSEDMNGLKNKFSYRRLKYLHIIGALKYIYNFDNQPKEVESPYYNSKWEHSYGPVYQPFAVNYEYFKEKDPRYNIYYIDLKGFNEPFSIEFNEQKEAVEICTNRTVYKASEFQKFEEATNSAKILGIQNLDFSYDNLVKQLYKGGADGYTCHGMYKMTEQQRNDKFHVYQK